MGCSRLARCVHSSVNKPGANARVCYNTLTHSRLYCRDRRESRSWIKKSCVTSALQCLCYQHCSRPQVIINGPDYLAPQVLKRSWFLSWHLSENQVNVKYEQRCIPMTDHNFMIRRRFYRVRTKDGPVFIEYEKRNRLGHYSMDTVRWPVNFPQIWSETSEVMGSPTTSAVIWCTIMSW